MSHRKAMWKAKDVESRRDSLLSAIDATICAVDVSALAQHFGTNPPSNLTEEEKKTKKDMTSRRDVLRRALLTKCEVLLPRQSVEGEKEEGEKKKRFEDAMKTLESWICVKSCPKYVLLLANRDRAKNLRATEMKHVNALLKMWDTDASDMSAKCAGEKDLARSALRKRRTDCIAAMSSWSHWLELERARTSLDFPNAYPCGFSS